MGHVGLFMFVQPSGKIDFLEGPNIGGFWGWGVTENPEAKSSDELFDLILGMV